MTAAHYLQTPAGRSVTVIVRLSVRGSDLFIVRKRFLPLTGALG